MKLFILTLFFSSFVMAADCVNCGRTIHPIVTPVSLPHLIEHWGATRAQVSSAPCKHNSFNAENMSSWLESKTGTRDRRINGVRFKDESDELYQAFRNITRGNIQNTFAINPACEKVLCAVDKIWGRDVGRKLLYMNMVYGFNGSELTNRNAERFTDSELDDVLLSLEDLPRHMIRIFRNRPLYKSAVPHASSPMAAADSTVRLFGLWKGADSPTRQYELMHEFGHTIHEKLPRAPTRQWISMSSWVKMGDKWSYDTIGACMVSKYGMSSPYEDFAETFTTYRYNGQGLLDLCPQKYEFMKQHVFNGVEFRETSQCQGR